MKDWCVVQDLYPFGVRIDSRHFTRAGAHFAANRSGYLEVMKIEEVCKRNEESTLENFKKDLRKAREAGFTGSFEAAQYIIRKGGTL